MYQPKFNSVLVEIDDKDAQWGGENNENMLGKSYSKGKVVVCGRVTSFKDVWLNEHDRQDVTVGHDNILVGKSILWNESAEAGTTFEEDGKLYGFIYWWDIRGVKE